MGKLKLIKDKAEANIDLVSRAREGEDEALQTLIRNSMEISKLVSEIEEAESEKEG